MSMVSASTKNWTWAPEVLEFAEKHQVSAYLDPMMEATRELFTDAREMRVTLTCDPEIDNDWHFEWEVDVPMPNLDAYREHSRNWGQVLFRLVPGPLTCIFRQLLIPVK